MKIKTSVSALFVMIHLSMAWAQSSFTPSEKFEAVGVNVPEVEYLEPGWPVPRELEKVAVEVHFDLLPVKMRFSLPCYPSMVTENNIHFSNGWTETYDPQASSSCEILWDRDSRYARMWIESQNPARIIVRARAAIADPDGYIGHSDIPSGSPYGKGDWTDEWYYIYPDGTHTRHVRIYTGLAGQSLTVTDETFSNIPPVREIPPNVVHEFQEDFVFGLDGHIPTDDIETSPITLINPDGSSKTFSYQPYPKGFGDYIKANIKVVNLKSQYKPFTISMPYGIENETYPPEGDLPFIFQTWGGHDGEGYSTSLGHTLNWWHFRRTDNILEQVYLSGFVTDDNMLQEMVDLERSWIVFPRLMMEGLPDAYTQPVYSQEQKAYIIPGDHRGAKETSFTLGFPEGDDELPLPVQIVNPVFVVKNWGDKDVEVKMNGKVLEAGKDFRRGYETQPGGMDMILWIEVQSSQPLKFSLKPEEK
jgi:hypothetical protein